MLFKMEADMEFEAENLEDAYKKLTDHFSSLHEACIKDTDSKSIIVGGKIAIHPCKPDRINEYKVMIPNLAWDSDRLMILERALDKFRSEQMGVVAFLMKMHYQLTKSQGVVQEPAEFSFVKKELDDALHYWDLAMGMTAMISEERIRKFREK